MRTLVGTLALRPQFVLRETKLFLILAMRIFRLPRRKPQELTAFPFLFFLEMEKPWCQKKKKTGKALGGKKAGRDEETSSHYPLHSPPPPTSASCVSQSSRVLSSLRLNRKNSFKQVDASSPFWLLLLMQMWFIKKYSRFDTLIYWKYLKN